MSQVGLTTSPEMATCRQSNTSGMGPSIHTLEVMELVGQALSDLGGHDADLPETDVERAASSYARLARLI